MVASKDLSLGLLVMLVWAANAVVIKFITLEVEPFTGLAIRLILGSLVLVPFFRWPGRDKFLRISLIVLFMAVLHWGSLIWSIDRLEASMASILMQIQVIFAVLIGRFFFKETFGWRTGAGIALGILGVVILTGLPENPPDFTGVAGMVFSMFTIAVSYALMKPLKDIHPVNYMAHMHLLAALPVIGLALFFETPLEADWRAVDYTILIPALLFQVFMVGGVHVIWQRLMTRNAMSGLPNLTLLLPVLGVIFAMIFLGERVALEMVFGGILTMIGVGIVMVRRQKRAERL